MSEYITLLIIGLALSLDAFSVALSIGTIITNNKSIIIATMVGIFHFFMPLLGIILGDQIMKIFHLSGEFLIAIIFFYISFEMIKSVLQNDEITWNSTIFGILLFSFGVSIDSFSIGLGLKTITDNLIFAVSIFALCSFLFTYLGLIIGKYVKSKVGNISNVIGATILIILGIIHLL